ncbi:hypothetical protein EYC80_006500 [Monilinia laxa]|uniref:Uncharacterized protein n=1 Tax=Monilinia laxa TaxID=61186 RepID=A0A5N6JS44_MONLA|nr:hypothetical protein EYC80_006500 [Monilinia laxa]
MRLSSPTPPPSYTNQQNLDPSTPNRRLSSFNYTYKNNPNDPLEVLYTLSPPAFHYLPRSTLLPPQIVRKGFVETPENSPPLLEGTRMQIMVIPRGVRTIVIHFLVYDPLRKKAHPPPSPPSPMRNRNCNPSPPRTPNPKSSTGKLRKMESNNRLSSPNSKARDQITSLRSTSRLSNHSEPNVRSNLDGMEIEVVGKSTVARIGEERDEEGEGEGEGEYVVMKRVVQLPRKVWCGRNCKDKFEQLFIRRS